MTTEYHINPSMRLKQKNMDMVTTLFKDVISQSRQDIYHTATLINSITIIQKMRTQQLVNFHGNKRDSKLKLPVGNVQKMLNLYLS